MDVIIQFFKNLNTEQIERFEKLLPLYEEWNAQINVISRKDIQNLYVHHILHSLAVAKFVAFRPTTRILDLGTGGGFPGLPLAILFPESEFILVDSIKKKLLVVDEIAKSLDLNNITTIHSRVEDLQSVGCDFVVTRAVAPADKLWTWSRKHLLTTGKNAIPNGLIALKGGNIKAEMKLLPKNEYAEFEAIQTYFPLPFFEEKFILYVQR